jgi:hypothetical protein
MKINRADNSKKQGLRRNNRGPRSVFTRTKRRGRRPTGNDVTSFADAGETVVIADDDEPTMQIKIPASLGF